MGIHGSRGFGWIWVENVRKLRFGLGHGLRNESFCMLMDNGLDLGNIFREKRFGDGFGFSVMGRVGFGPEILHHEGL